mmetsp:Transcript_81050/g.156539  ORF Transcript_81050/g.156539 Transcript_81050/m.156539 type:complete len:233 (+) Transcript_81050:157-855(+)
MGKAPFPVGISSASPPSGGGARATPELSQWRQLRPTHPKVPLFEYAVQSFPSLKCVAVGAAQTAVTFSRQQPYPAHPTMQYPIFPRAAQAATTMDWAGLSRDAQTLVPDWVSRPGPGPRPGAGVGQLLPNWVAAQASVPDWVVSGLVAARASVPDWVHLGLVVALNWVERGLVVAQASVHFPTLPILMLSSPQSIFLFGKDCVHLCLVPHIAPQHKKPSDFAQQLASHTPLQ